MYTHVAADNEVAYGLYIGCGFQEHSIEKKYENASNLGELHGVFLVIKLTALSVRRAGKLVLLQAMADVVLQNDF